MVENDNKNINELIATYNLLENQLKALVEQKNRYLLIIEELRITKESVENLSIGSINYINIGSIVGIPAKIEKDTFLVNIGSNVMVELPKEKVVEFIEDRLEFIHKEITKLDEIINIYQDKMNEIAIKVQEMSTKGK